MSPKYHLRYQTQEGAPKSIPLQGTEWTLGRSSNNRIPIGDATVSREHAVLRQQGKTFFLRELQPKNPILDEHLQPIFTNSDPDGHFVQEAELPADKPILMGSTWIWLEKVEVQSKVDTQFNLGESHLLPTTEGIRCLSEFANDLLKPADHETRAMGALKTIQVLVPFRRAIIGLFEDDHQLRMLASIQPEGEGSPSRPEIIVSDTVAARIRAKKEPFLVGDTKEEVTLQDRHSVIALGIRSVLAAPLLWDDQAKGIIYFDRGNKEPQFKERDLNAVTLISRLISLSLQSYETEQNLALLSSRQERAVAGMALATGSKTKNPKHLEVVGSSKIFQEHLATLRNVADHDVATLILGESGSGKEVAARLIHQWSNRAKKPIITLNCAAIQDTLLEMELFGYHPKAALAGMDPQGKKGRIQLADQGILFLDEIGDLSLRAQAKLLRVLETHELEPLGCEEPVSVDIRLIAATNKDLKELMEKGLFRKDLYFRLAAFVINVPLLSCRSDDVIVLAQAFLTKKATMLGIATPRISPAAIELLRAYHWPGNIRELKHFMEQALILGAHTLVTPEELPQELRNTSPTIPIVRLPLATVERTHIQKVLSYCRGNVRMAARVLGIATSTLYDKIKRYGLEGEVSRSRTDRRAAGLPANQKNPDTDQDTDKSPLEE